MSGPIAYGQTRERRAVLTYGEIERAATAILKTGTRPTLEGIREVLGGGSPRTILDALNRYWRDLGSQVAGKPDTLLRLPSAVADLAEGLWQRALLLAADAAKASSSEGEAQLLRLKGQLELRAHTLSQREVELDELLRSRERTLKEMEDHLRAAMSLLSKRDVTISSLESRLAAALQETDSYRQRLAGLIRRAVVRHQRGTQEAALKPTKNTRPLVRPKSRKARRRPSSKRVNRR